MDQQTTPIHPTRSAPLCVDCRWLQRTIGGAVQGGGLCNHPSTPVNPLYGIAMLPVLVARQSESICSGGRRFERSHAAGCETCHGKGMVFRAGHDVACPSCTPSANQSIVQDDTSVAGHGVKCAAQPAEVLVEHRSHQEGTDQFGTALSGAVPNGSLN